jgi:uncharacterized LabA/DUF88 family protein
MPETRPTAIVYIDGLNLYRYLKSAKPGYQRVNIARLCELILPSLEIQRIKYFTAMMKTLDGNAEPSIKQNLYLDQLQNSDSRISIHLGRIRIDTRIYPQAPKATDEVGRHLTAKIFKFEEKETDVNIAATMVADAACKLADVYVLVSSDSDFKPLESIMTKRMGAQYIQVSVRDILGDVVARSQFLFFNLNGPPSFLGGPHLTIATVRKE